MFLLPLLLIAGAGRARPPDEALQVRLEVEAAELDAEALSQALVLRGATLVETDGDLDARIAARSLEAARIFDVTVTARDRLPTTTHVLVPEAEATLCHQLLALAILQSPPGAPVPLEVAPPPPEVPSPTAVTHWRWSAASSGEVLASAGAQVRLGLDMAAEERVRWLRLEQALLLQVAPTSASDEVVLDPDLAVPATRAGLRLGLAATRDAPRGSIAGGLGLEAAWGEPRVLSGDDSARAREQLDLSLQAMVEVAGSGTIQPLLRLRVALPLMDAVYNPIGGTVPLAPTLGLGLGFRVAP